MTTMQDRPVGWGGVDAFEVLGLPYDPDLTDGQVRAAYLVRLRAVHPDHGGDVECAAAVTAAFEALRSGVRRGELLAAVTVETAPVAAPTETVWWRARVGERARARAGAKDAEEERGPGGRPGPVRMAELRRKVAASRAEQGLPPFITDEATLDRIVDLLVAMEQREGVTAGVRARPGSPSLAGRPVGRDEVSSELGRAGAPVPAAGSWWVRVRYGRPGWLAARVVVAAAVVVIAGVVVPGDPAVWALGVGALTWLVRTGRWDLAPRARR